jgi:Tfp pilus assembly protein PilN
MINLLPPEIKQDYAYALRNTGLRRWVAVLAASIVGLGLVATLGLVTLQHSTNTFDKQVKVAQDSLQSQKLKQTEAQVTDFSNSFKLVVQVLSKEVLFSKLLKQIATVIPSNVNLTGLNIVQTTGAIDISAAAKDYNTATQVQVNLADPNNKIFSKADIVSIACSASPSDPKHPCTVQIRALFATKNPFLFVNAGGS